MFLEKRKGGGGRGGSSGSKGSKGSSSKGSSSSAGKKSPLSNTKSSISSTSKGGGKPALLPKGSLFAGRLSGGGSRVQVYGYYYYGSGYPYGGYGYYVERRPFPFVFWPVYIYHNGEYGSSEYGPANNPQRPGGPEIAVSIKNGVNGTETYRIMGDNDSVRAMIPFLMNKCHATSSAVYAFDPASTNGTANSPRPEQAVQYYRSSSFLLSLDGYNNSASLASNAPTSNTTAPKINTQTPLPSNIDKAFLYCVNTTIAENISLVDNSRKHLSNLAISAIIFASLLAFIGLLSCIHCIFSRRKSMSFKKPNLKKPKLKLPWKSKTGRYQSLDDALDNTDHHHAKAEPKSSPQFPTPITQ